MSQNRNNSYCHIAFVMLFFLIFCAAKTLQVNIRGDYYRGILNIFPDKNKGNRAG